MTIKCSIETVKEVCIVNTTHDDFDWLWHMRHDHLNFRSLSHQHTLDEQEKILGLKII